MFVASCTVQCCVVLCFVAPHCDKLLYVHCDARVLLYVHCDARECEMVWMKRGNWMTCLMLCSLHGYCRRLHRAAELISWAYMWKAVCQYSVTNSVMLRKNKWTYSHELRSEKISASQGDVYIIFFIFHTKLKLKFPQAQVHESHTQRNTSLLRSLFGRE